MPSRRLLTMSLALFMGFAASVVDAQYYRRGRGGSVFVRAPFVGVNVTPGGVSVRAPGVNVNSPRGGFAYGAPVVVPGAVVPVAPSPTIAASPTSPQLNGAKLSEAELAALGLADLLAELANRSNELNAELARLGGGQAWQTYLALPGEINRGVADPALLGRLLARFDSVARDQQFRMITALSSFDPVRTALRVTVDRFTVAPSTPPAAPAAPSQGPALKPEPAEPAEPLPTPEADAGAGERSVLSL